MENRIYFESDDYGIVGMSFTCDFCKNNNRFIITGEWCNYEFDCEYCGREIIFTDDEKKRIDWYME